MQRESGSRVLPPVLAAFLLAAPLLAACSGLDVTGPQPRPGFDIDVSNGNMSQLSIIATRQNFPVRTWNVPPETDVLIAVRKQPWADRLTGGPVQFLLSTALDQRLVKSELLDLDPDDVVEIVVPDDLQQATIAVRDD